MSTILGVPIDAAYHIVFALAGVLAPLLGGLAAAAAIVLFTMGVRLLLVPVSYRAMKGMNAQARIATQVQALRQRHSGQPEALQRALAALYRSEGTSAFAGCLPILVQWPFFSVMYLLFRSPVVAGARNALLTHDLFGAPLGSHWLSAAGPFSAPGAVFAGLFLLLACLGWLSARMTRATAVPRAATAPGAAATGAASALMKAVPYLTVVFAAFLPLASGLYLATTSTWTLAERALLRKRLGAARPELAARRRTA